MVLNEPMSLRHWLTLTDIGIQSKGELSI